MTDNTSRPLTFSCNVPAYNPPPIDFHVVSRSSGPGKYFLILTPRRLLLSFPGQPDMPLDLEIRPWGGTGAIDRMDYQGGNKCATWTIHKPPSGCLFWRVRITPQGANRLFDDDTSRMAVFSLDVAPKAAFPALGLIWCNLPEGGTPSEAVVLFP